MPFFINSDQLKKSKAFFIDICFSIAAAGRNIFLASKSKWVEFYGAIVIGSGTLP